MDLQLRILLILLISPFWVLSQSQDTLSKPKSIQHGYLGDFEVDTVHWEHDDSTLVDFHSRYFLFPQYLVSNGNLGGPSKSVVFDYDVDLGFDLGLRPNLRKGGLGEFGQYFRVNQPATRIYYHTATRQEQLLQVDHTQNLSPSWNVGIQFERLSSQGFYFRQRVTRSLFRMHTNYQSRNGRYSAFADLNYEDVLFEENGGISEDSLFTGSTDGTRDAIPVFLEEAQNTYQDLSFSVVQYLNLGKQETIIDRIDSSEQIKLTPTNRFFLATELARIRHQYEDDDPDSAFYAGFSGGFDLTRVNDQIRGWTVLNKVGWQFGSSQNAFVVPGKGSFWLGNQVVDIGQNSRDERLTNLMAGASYGFNWDDRLILETSGDVVFGGAQAGESSLGGELSYLFGTDSTQIQKANRLWGGLSLKNRWAPFLWEGFDSDLGGWTAAAENAIGIFELTGGFSNVPRKFDASAHYFLISNYVYFDSLAFARQLDGTLSVLQFRVRKDFKLGKFHWVPGVVLQQADRDELVGIPQMATHQSVFLESSLFKQALFFRMGIDAYYSLSYFAEAYSPVTKQFHLQRDQELGNYPFLDFFFAAKIKSARAFVRVSHLNQGLTGDNFYSIPGYPMSDRQVRVGVDWLFLN